MPRVIILLVFVSLNFFAHGQLEEEILPKKVLDSLQAIVKNDSLASIVEQRSQTIKNDSIFLKAKKVNDILIKGLVPKKDKLGNFINLSLVDRGFFTNFDVGIEALKSRYRSEQVLLTVTTGFSEQRVFFLSKFYTQVRGGETEYTAYVKALELTQKVFQTLDFKYYYLNPVE